MLPRPTIAKHRGNSILPRFIMLFIGFLTPFAFGTTPVEPRQHQFEAWRWAQFTLESGLPSNDITALAETQDGIVWTGTTSGLAWYDDYRWNTIDSSSGLPRVRIIDLFPTHGESLYVVTYNGVFEGSRAGFRRLPMDLSGEVVLFGEEDLLIYDEHSLTRYHRGRTTQFGPYPEVAKGEPRPLHRSNDGQIYLNSLSGLFRWEQDRWNLVIPASSNRSTISSIADGTAGKRGFASVDLPIELRGVWKWGPGTPAHLTQENRKFIITAMDVNPAGELLGITTDGEPYFLTDAGAEKTNFNLSQIENIHLLRYRRNGSLWVGTADGLFYYNATADRWRFWKHAVSDPHNTVNEILRAKDGSIWLATEGGLEIHAPDGTTRRMDTAGDVRLQILTGLAEDADGNIWVSSGASLPGAFRWNGSRWDHFDIGEKPKDTRIHKIRKDRQGRLWFLGLSGDFERNSLVDHPGAFVLENGRFTRWSYPEGLMSGRVYAFAQTPDSTLWFGTLGGINRWKKGRWTYWTMANGMLQPNIFTLASDERGRVWFAGQTSRLGYIEKDSVHYLPEAQFPIRGNIWDLHVAPDDGLWISDRSEVISHQDSTWLVYDGSSGLGKFESWPLLPLDHEVYVGTHGNGVAILNLRETPPPFPKIYLDKPIVEDASVLIRWRSLAFWDEIPPKNIQSRFSIDGRPWSDWDVRTEVMIDTLAPGAHMVTVEAKGLLGNFSPGVEKAFFIDPPFYQQPKSIVVGSIVLASIGGLGLMLVMRKRRHAAELRQSELKFRRLTEATFEGIALHDAGVIIDANQSILRIFGYEYREFLGMSVLDIVAPEYREVIRQTMIAENETPLEAVGRKRDGTEIYVEIIGKMIPDDKRTVSVVAIRDITERKRTEERLLMYQEQLRSLAQELSTTEEHERRQMATYLHDTIGQALAFCKIKLGQLKDAGSSSELQEVRKLIEETLKNAQSLTFELSPPILYELSFEEAVEWLCEHHQKQHHMAVAFEADERPQPLPDEVRIILYNAVRELLVNVAKHSGACNASVRIRHSERRIDITVSDNGKGFVPAKTPSISNHGGFGLFNIRERLAHLGGKLHIDATPGKGTAVTISLPLPGPQHGSEA